MPSPKGKSPVLCQAATSYKKKNGSLVLTRTALSWSNAIVNASSSKGEGELSFDNARLNSLFMSKEGGAKVVMKVGVLDKPGVMNEESYNFTFISGPSAVSDREHFKREISQIISKNRASAGGASGSGSAAASPAPAPAPAPGPSTPSAFAGLPSPAEAARGAPAAPGAGSRASPAPIGASADGTPRPSGSNLTQDWQVRGRLLKSQPELANLHASLVRTGLITEEEFWEGRENLLLSEAAVSLQRSGRSSQLVDPRPEQGDNGEVKIKLSQQLIKDIFDQYPIVGKIYNENVPTPLSEGEFWHRYFHSKLFDRHRMTGRGSLESQGGMSGKGKDDAVFDKYLEDEDDDLEPKNAREDDVYRLLDLAATEEDHAETGNAKDFTMRAGSQRKSLPLMRRFNEHSERLLIQSLGASGAFRKNNQSIDGGNAGSRDYYADIVNEDLNEGEKDGFIPLTVKEGSHQGAHDPNRRDGMSLMSQENDDDDSAASFVNKRKRLTSEEAVEVLLASSKRLKNCHPDLGSLLFPISTANSAVNSFNQLISSRVNNNSSSSSSTTSKSFPEPILRSLISLHSSTNEFLRHFWSALLPSAINDISAAGMANPAQKASKAKRMLEFLVKTEERLEGVCKEQRERMRSDWQSSDNNNSSSKGKEGQVSESEFLKEQEMRVREAMGPTMEAVKKAREEWRRRTSAAAPVGPSSGGKR